MKILKVSIHNYRSICDLVIICEPVVILLGPNNHGKSNILSAIEFGIMPGIKPDKSDFNAFCGDNLELWVDITFHELTNQEKTTFKKYLRDDETFSIRKSARFVEGKIEIGIHGYIQEPDQSWLKESAVTGLANREAISEIPLNNYVPTTGRITQDIVRDAQKNYIQNHNAEIIYHETLESTNFLGPKNIGGGSLPEFYLIPAVRDLTDETKIKGATVFGKLLSRTIQEMAERDPNFIKLRDGIENLIQTLNRSTEGGDQRPEQLIELEQSIESELLDWGVGVEVEVIPPTIEKFFELGTNIHLDDGVRTPAENKGHGLQRALIFALFRALAKSLRNTQSQNSGIVPRTSSESVIFAVEEPELFLHPHAQKKMAIAISEIAKSPNHQVMICSHSSHFVDLDNYKSICIVSKSNSKKGTELRQCAVDLFPSNDLCDRKNRFRVAHWINPDRGEMFFAKRIVFVEGETEKTIFPYLANRLNCYDPEISIIDCGSKFNLPLYIAVANAFKMRYIVVYDEDPLPNQIPTDWSSDKISEKQRTYGFNLTINDSINKKYGDFIMLNPDFEGLANVSRRQGNTKGKALAALEHFSLIETEEISPQIQGVVRGIYL